MGIFLSRLLSPRPRRALALGALGSLALHLLPAVAVSAQDGPNASPELASPTNFTALADEAASFNVRATDPDGDAVEIRLVSGDLPGAHFERAADGVSTFSITPGQALVGSATPLVFEARDARGAAVTTTTTLRVGAARGGNPPSVLVPKRIYAVAKQQTETLVEAFDPDDAGPVSVAVDSPAGLAAVVAPSSEPRHFFLRVSPTKSQAGQAIPVTVTATDATGATTSVEVSIVVVRKQDAGVLKLEVRWDNPPPGDPFEAPVSIEAFSSSNSDRLLATDDTLLSYVIYASDGPNVELTEENLVGVANASWRNGHLTFVTSQARGGNPFGGITVRCTTRRPNGESAGSKETTTDTPRFPAVKFVGGKLVVPAESSNILPGAQLEVRGALDGAGEVFDFASSPSGKSWVIRASARSSPGNRTLGELLVTGQQVILVTRNANGRTSPPLSFVP